MNLVQELEKTAQGFAESAPEEVKLEMQKAHDELVKNKVGQKALRNGNSFPQFKLFNQSGEFRSLDDLLEKNKFLVISFYRGGWCPYCNLELRALQEKRSEFSKLDAGLVAITPEKADNSLTTAEKNDLSFDVLSDLDSKLGKELGLSFELPENLKPIYQKFGINIPEHNGKDNFTLPVPATYLIDQYRNIHYSFVDIDYKVRANPDEILAKLKELNQ